MPADWILVLASRQLSQTRSTVAPASCRLSRRRCYGLLRDTILQPQEIPQLARQDRREFLPGHHLAARPEIDKLHCADHGIPLFTQVGTPRVRHDAERAPVRLRRQDITDQLISEVAAVSPRQSTAIKDIREIAVCLELRTFPAL